MTTKPHFTPGLFRFLEDLAANNDREWFQANKARYEADVKEPILRFVLDFGPKLERISPHVRADPRPVGGSLFRIHRDTRFSKDKSPYKTHAAAQFRHAAGKDVHAPCFYLHLEPGNVFAGCGIWHPDGPSLKGIRDAIVADPARWKRVLAARGFRETWSLSGDSLKRPPRGYDPEHPLVADIKRKDFIGVTSLTQREVCAGDFLTRFTAVCRKGAGLMGFLADALDLPW